MRFESGRFGAYIAIRLLREPRRPDATSSVELRTSTLGAPPMLETEAPRDGSQSLAFTADSKLQQDFVFRRNSADSEELPNPLLAQRIRNIIDDDEEEELDTLTEPKQSVQTNKFKNTLDHIHEEIQKMAGHHPGLLAPLLGREDSSGPPPRASVPEDRFGLVAAIEEQPLAEDEEFRSAREGEGEEEQELFTVLEGPASVLPRPSGPAPADQRSLGDEEEFRSALDFHTAYNLSRTDE